MGRKPENHYLTGKLLLAMPNMNDPRFHRAIILICSHDENGAMGLVVNHEMPDIEFPDLIGQLKIESDILVNFQNLDLPVMCGGPVESARGFLLHSSDFKRDGTIDVGSSYGVTGTLDALKDVACGLRPDDMLFILGYAGWDAKQLDAEIHDNAWLVVDPDRDIVFGHGDAHEKWMRAVSKLGFDPSMLSSVSGHA